MNAWPSRRVPGSTDVWRNLIRIKKLTLKVVLSSRHSVSESCCSCHECFIQKITFSFTYLSQISSNGRRLKPHSAGLGQHIRWVRSTVMACIASKSPGWVLALHILPPHMLSTRDAGVGSGPGHTPLSPRLFSSHKTFLMFSCRAPMPLLWKKTLVQSSFRLMNTTSGWSM